MLVALVERRRRSGGPAPDQPGQRHCRPAAGRRRGPGVPRTVRSPLTQPRRPILIVVAKAARVRSARPRCRRRAPRPVRPPVQQLAVPLMAGPSSSPVISRLIEPAGAPFAARRAGRRRDEGGDAALHVRGAPAIKLAVARSLPRTGRRPRRARIAGRHDIGVTGEAEVGPRLRPAWHTGCRSAACRRPRTAARWQTKPSGSSALASTSSAPASAGVTLGQRIRAWVSATGSASAGCHQSRSSSLIEVLERVLSSTA